MDNIKLYIEKEYDNMFSSLDRLVTIPSVGSDACVVEIEGKMQEAPFGEQALRVLYEVRDIAREMGLYAEIYANRMTVIDLYKEGDPVIGILAHGDVVPPGSGWSYDGALPRGVYRTRRSACKPCRGREKRCGAKPLA